jgi:hypothetical protein
MRDGEKLLLHLMHLRRHYAACSVSVSCIPLAFSAPYIVYRRMFLSFWASIFMLHKTKKRGGKDDEDGEKK